MDQKPGAQPRQSGYVLVAGARHHRLLRLHWAQPRQLENFRGDRRISGQGMTHGVVAGLLIRDLVVIGSSPWEKTLSTIPRARPQQALESLSAKT